MDRFLVKLFDPNSRYTYVEAETPLNAAEKFTGRKLKDTPPGDVVALVRIVVDDVITTSPFYASEQVARPGAGPPVALPKSTRETVVTWCAEERTRLLKEIEEVENGGMIVQRITRDGPVDVTGDFLAARRQQLESLGDVVKSLNKK